MSNRAEKSKKTWENSMPLFFLTNDNLFEKENRGDMMLYPMNGKFQQQADTGFGWHIQIDQLPHGGFAERSDSARY